MSEKRKQPLSQKLLFCLEDESYKAYVASEFKLGNDSFVPYDQFVFQVAENPQGILVLQSDSHENDLIEICKKLKRLFSDTIRVVLLSADYQVYEYARTVVDAFVHFPISKDELVETIRALSEKKRRILVIDDSKLVHKHLVPPLEAEGYEVVSAYDGSQGVEAAKKSPPDLIISDIEMPVMNGFEAVRAIRSVPALREVPIIMSSTLSSVADQRRGFAAGVDDYVTKPVHIPDLLARLDLIFKRNLAGRENILVVESDPTLARATVQVLSRQGFSPRVCSTLGEAIKVLRRFSHELVLCESELSDGSALDLLKAMKDLPSAGNSGMLVFTEAEGETEAKMLTQAGARGTVTKPFNHDSLLAAVERTLAKLKAEVEKAHMEKYVSKASRKMALEKSILSGSDSAARAYRKNATIFFSDIVNFTARCERYTPREIVDQINTLFSVMTRVITESGGDIDKFIGDACMAFWMDEDPVRSARSAMGFLLRIRGALNEMNEKDPLLKDDPILIRMGVNTGDVILCDIGSADARIDLTMIGDPVNLAARLESASKQYGLDNLVSSFSLGSLKDEFVSRPIDLIRVKGKAEPVEVFELIGLPGQVTPEQQTLVDTFTTGVLAFRAGKFPQAMAAFEASAPLERHPTKLNPSSLMQERCQTLTANPPEAWDGVWTLTSK